MQNKKKSSAVNFDLYDIGNSNITNFKSNLKDKRQSFNILPSNILID